jgi:Type I restriction enzyme R protein N terminus (HSDR_N)
VFGGFGIEGRCMSEPVKVDRKNGKIWSHIRKKWLEETPEETVRQEYLANVLVKEYGFSLTQIAEEYEVTGRGSAHARADFVIWRTAADKLDKNPPLIIVECKSDNVTIRPYDYGQGDIYVREFCENPAYIQAVVSLPSETFLSSGASIKASLLFLQKFTEDQQSDFSAKQKAALEETEAKHAPAILRERKRIQSAIEANRNTGGANIRKTLERELTEFERKMDQTLKDEARILLKKRFSYPIFLYQRRRAAPFQFTPKCTTPFHPPISS